MTIGDDDNDDEVNLNSKQPHNTASIGNDDTKCFNLL